MLPPWTCSSAASLDLLLCSQDLGQMPKPLLRVSVSQSAKWVYVKEVNDLPRARHRLNEMKAVEIYCQAGLNSP